MAKTKKEEEPKGKMRPDGRYPATRMYTDPITFKHERLAKFSRKSWADADKKIDEHIAERERLAKELKEKAEREELFGFDVSALTLGQWITDWLNKTKTDKIRTNSWERYESLNRVHVVPHIGELKLVDVKPVHILNFLAERKTAPVCRRKNPTPEQLANAKLLSARSIEYLYVMLNASFDQAVKIELLEKNPCAGIEKPRANSKIVEPFTDEEMNRFLDVARKHYLYPLFILDWYTGCRSSELLGLRWKNVNLDAGYIDIEEATMQTRKGAINDLPKNDYSYRRIGIAPTAIQTLKMHKEIQDAHIEEYGLDYNNNGYVFPDKDGNLIPNYVVSKEFKKMAIKAKINPDAKFHHIRHTHATTLLENGEHPYDIQSQMGHGTQAMSRLYAHSSYKNRQGIAKKMEEKMDKIKNTNNPMLSDCCQTATDLTTK